MSVAAVKWAWDQLDLSGAEKLVLLRLADHASPDGTNIRPGRKSIAAYCGMSERQVERYIQGFLERGLIAYQSNEKGGRGKVPEFYIPAVKRDTDDALLASQKATPVSPNQSQRATPVTVKGDTHDGTLKEEPLRTVNTRDAGRKIITVEHPRKNATPQRSPAQQIMDAFCAATGIERLANYDKAGGQAKLLLKAGITADDIPEIVEWLRPQPWLKDGFDLGTVLSQVTKWQTSKVSRKAAGPPGVTLLPGEIAVETAPGEWELSRGDRKRYLSPHYYGVIWDPEKYRGSDGTKAFRAAVAEAKQRYEQEAA